MDADRFRVKLDGAPATDDLVTADALAVALETTAKLLTHESAQQKPPNVKAERVQWGVKELKQGSAEYALVPVGVSPAWQHTATTASERVAARLDQVQRGGDVEELFPSLPGEVRRLAKMIRDSLARVTIQAGAVLTVLTPNQFGLAASPPETLTSTSTIDGIITGVILRDNDRHFNLTRQRDGRTVRCDFGPVASLDVVLEHLRSRQVVFVSGRLHRDDHGRPVRLTGIRKIEPSVEPLTIADLIEVRRQLDPTAGVTDGMSSEAWTRSKRDE